LAVSDLVDHRSAVHYLYQILVFTGIRRNSGANARVNFILEGDEGETDVRALLDSNRKILQRGSIDSFLMGVPRYIVSFHPFYFFSKVF
jgi:polycystin 1L2